MEINHDTNITCDSYFPVTWMFNGKKSLPQNVAGRSTIIITSVTLKNRGIYLCLGHVNMEYFYAFSKLYIIGLSLFILLH